jgi:hypothetical protein
VGGGGGELGPFSYLAHFRAVEGPNDTFIIGLKLKLWFGYVLSDATCQKLLYRLDEFSLCRVSLNSVENLIEDRSLRQYILICRDLGTWKLFSKYNLIMSTYRVHSIHYHRSLRVELKPGSSKTKIRFLALVLDMQHTARFRSPPPQGRYFSKYPIHLRQLRF